MDNENNVSFKRDYKVDPELLFLKLEIKSIREEIEQKPGKSEFPNL